jgi:hypothetical protein
MQCTTLCLMGLILVGAEARAQAGDSSSTDVFKKVSGASHVSVSNSDVFRRAAQAKEAAEAGRPDVIATDPNQVEAQVVRRDSIDILHRAPANAAAAPVTPVAPAAAPPPTGVPSAIANAFSSAPDAPEPAPAAAPVAPKPRRAAPHVATAAAHVAAAAPPPAPEPPKETATVVQPGAVPAIARMGSAPPPPAKAVFNDTLSTLDREAQSVSQDVAPKYAAQRASMDSVRSAHNARLDSLEATEGTIADSTERKFEHKMAEAARIKGKGGTPPDTARAKTH